MTTIEDQLDDEGDPAAAVVRDDIITKAGGNPLPVKKVTGADLIQKNLDTLAFRIDDIIRMTKDSIAFASVATAARDAKGTLKLLKQDLQPPKPKREKKAKPESRAARWARVAGEASAALAELKEIQEEFETWKDSLPENLQQSSLGEKLETICGIDLDSAVSAAEEAEGAEVPLGFGRD